MKLIVIVGPTGIGKTDLSINIAKHFDTHIISSDSRQVYSELKIGTAPPSPEQLSEIKHYMIANKSIHDYYNASMYELEVIDLIKNISQQKDSVLLVGGSGMYVDAVCYGIDDLPNIDQDLRNSLIKKYNDEGIESIRFDLKILDFETYKKIDLHNSKRILKALEISIQTGIPYSKFLTKDKKKRCFEIIKIGIDRDRAELHQRINQRVDIMVADGLVEEAKMFYKYKENNSLNTVGYKELFAHFDGEYNIETAIELVKRNSRRYARRQLTWFNKYSDIEWFHPSEEQKIIDYITTR